MIILFLLAGCFVYAIVACLNSCFSDKKESEKTANTSGYDDCFSVKDAGEIYLFHRDEKLKNAFEIVDAETLSISYKPQEIHVGAVSVGGVVSGGTYTTGGYNYVSGIQKTGKSQLRFSKKSVSSISLSDELYESAIKSSIAKYVDKSRKTILLFDVRHLWADSYWKEVMFRNMELYGTIGAEASREGQPTYEKCNEILNWICGVDF